jgi:WD repeat-containing protein 55
LISLLVHDLPKPGERKISTSDEEDSENDTILSSIPIHTMQISSSEQKPKTHSCRTVLFSSDGKYLFSGGSSGEICALDANMISSLGGSETSLLWRLPSHPDAVHCLKQLPESATCGPLLCSGYENGSIRLCDIRLCDASESKRACVLSWNEHEDYISGFDHDVDGNTLLASSADCSLSAMDLRMAQNPSSKSQACRKSDDQEDELLSVTVMKHGRKVICGSQQGVLAVWSWGTWGDVSDRFPGHPASIDALLKVDEDTVLTGASDGLIRLVQLHPDKLLGVLGEHEGYPVEKLQFNSDRSVVGSISHDAFLRLWDTKILFDDDNSEEGDEGEEDEVKTHGHSTVTDAFASAKTTPKFESDDDWDDTDDSEGSNDDSDDSEDSDKEKVVSANDRRSKRMKTENEKFFDDL